MTAGAKCKGNCRQAPLQHHAADTPAPLISTCLHTAACCQEPGSSNGLQFKYDSSLTCRFSRGTRPPASLNQSRQVSSWCCSPADRNIIAMRGKSSTALQRVGSRGPAFRYDLQTQPQQRVTLACTYPTLGQSHLQGACLARVARDTKVTLQMPYTVAMSSGQELQSVHPI